MAYLLSTFWFWLLLALVLGLVVGAITARREGEINWLRLMPWLAVLALGGLVSIIRLLPGRIGYAFDLAMLMLGAYVVGCSAACLWRRARAPERAALAPASGRVEPVLAAVPAERAVEPAKAGKAPVTVEAREEAVTGLSAPRAGKPDDLTQIGGIDAGTEQKLNALGLYHFDQIAGLTPGNRRWLFRQLGYEGRFPSWWWRWRHEAEQMMKAQGRADSGAATPALVSAMEAVAAPVDREIEGVKPKVLAAPREGRADDLKRIRGLGKQSEGRLHGLGVWHFEQIAGWSAEEMKWVGGFLAFPGRIEREDWQAQARLLAAGGETEFSRRADAGEVATSRDEAGDDGRSNIAVPGKDFAIDIPPDRKPRSKKP
jgi:predicted flap endonuclease-1-like 5' DNA nuclease